MTQPNDEDTMSVFELADAGVERQMGQALTLFKDKNRKYGNAISRTGVLGAVVEIIGAAARLPAMVLRATGHGRQDRNNLVDVLRDILNYAAIALYMISNDNWEGE